MTCLVYLPKSKTSTGLSLFHSTYPIYETQLQMAVPFLVRKFVPEAREGFAPQVLIVINPLRYRIKHYYTGVESSSVVEFVLSIRTGGLT